MADAADLDLSTRVGNSLCESGQIRGNRTNESSFRQSRAKLRANNNLAQEVLPNTLSMARRKYTNEELVVAVQNSYSIRGVLQKLGLAPTGGNYEMVTKRINELTIDTSHFLGQAILKGKTHQYATRPLQEILVHRKLENTWRLRRRLWAEGFKEHRCECCHQTEWLGKPIPLELHHIDGDRTNNTLHNIELLCPNCHALTDNYRGGKKKV